MNRLIRVTLASFAITAILCGAALIVGRAQPADPPLPELIPCGDRICVYGIQQPKTGEMEAQALLKQTGEFSDSPYSIQDLYKVTPLYYRIELFTYNDRLAEIDLNFHSNYAPGAAAIVSQLGLPCGIFTGMSGLIILRYPGMVVFLETRSPKGFPPRLDPDNQAQQIRLLDSDQCHWVGAPNNYPWHGFTSYPLPAS